MTWNRLFIIRLAIEKYNWLLYWYWGVLMKSLLFLIHLYYNIYIDMLTVASFAFNVLFNVLSGCKNCEDLKYFLIAI